MNEMMSKDIADNQSDKNLIATLEDLGYLPNGSQGGFLYDILCDEDPKVVSQAIYGH